MSGAIWIAAKGKGSSPWWPSWLRWRKKKTALHTSGCAAVAERPLVLVGSYERGDLLPRAQNEFAAAAFGNDDAVFVRACQAGEDSLWQRMRDCGRALLRRGAAPESSGVHVPLDPVFVDAVLAAGGGFVLVGSIQRFQQACEIIERTGGRIGRTGSAAA